MYGSKKVTAIIPAHNEAKGIANVIQEIQAVSINGNPVFDDIIVCDNNSLDNTAKIALKQNATVIFERHLGYGSACLAALQHISETDYVIFFSGDGAEIAIESITLLEKLDEGVDLAIGSRLLGRSERGALVPVQRVGNQIASFLLRFFWQQTVTDMGPFRGISYPSLLTLGMQDQDYGWTAEMQCKAFIHGLTVCEIPVTSLEGKTPSTITRSYKTILHAGTKIIVTICYYGIVDYISTRKRTNKLQGKALPKS